MRFQKPLIPGKLLRRYKRFLADVELADGTVVLAHCTNSGSMKSCIEVGAPVYLTPVNNPKRTTKFTWEMIFINNRWVGTNTGIPNLLVFEALREGRIPGLDRYTHVQREVTFGDSRFDVFAQNGHEQCFIEVKNVTMKVGHEALFPDAATVRGLKHLRTLMEVKKTGMRAVMFYVVQRQDITSFGPAKDIDPAYTAALADAIRNGVEIFAYMAEVNPKGIELTKKLQLIF